MSAQASSLVGTVRRLAGGCIAARWAAAVVLAAALVSVVLPVLINPIPPLLDYGGHLSRVYVTYDLLHGSGFADTYRLQFAVVPNLAVDAVVLGLMELGVPVMVAGQCFVALALLVMAAGVVLLHFAMFRRVSVWPVLAVPFLLNQIFAQGFLNFFFGVGVAFCVAAAWNVASRRDAPAAGLMLLVCAVVVFFCHLASLLLMLGLIVGCELGRLLWPANAFARAATKVPPHLARARVRYLAIATVCGGLPLLLMLATPLMADKHAPALAAFAGAFETQQIKNRIEGLFQVFWAYDHRIDIASLAILLCLGLYGILTGLLKIAAPMLLPITGLAFIYLVIPDGWFGTGALPTRLPIVIFMMLISASDFVWSRTWEAVTLLCLVLALSAVRSQSVDSGWHAANQRATPLLQALDALPRDTRIYSAIAYKGDFISNPVMPYWELPCFAVIRRHLFYPGTFAIPTQNLVVPQPAYEIAPAMPRNYRPDRPALLPPDDPYSDALLTFYDYALIVNPGLWHRTPPPDLLPIAVGPDYTLFRIDRRRLRP